MLFNSLVGIVQLALYMGAYFVVLMFVLLLAMVVLGLHLGLLLPATLFSGACHLYIRALQRHRVQAQLEPASGVDVAALKGKASAHA